jgi:hypothetical protein
VLRNAGTPLLCGLFGLHTSAPSSSTATSANETPVSLIADHCISLHTHLSHPIVACWKQRPHDGFMAHLGSIPHDHGSSVASCSAMKNSPSCTNLCYVLVAKRTINSLYDFEWATHLFRELNWIMASRINSQKMATTNFSVQKNNMNQKVIFNQQNYAPTITMTLIFVRNYLVQQSWRQCKWADASLTSSFHKLSRLDAQECNFSPVTLNVIARNISKIMRALIE